MSSSDIVVDVKNLSKCYEIYKTPRDRLKQIILPRLYQAANKLASMVGVRARFNSSCFYREFWALNDVSFQVRRGETLGVIGVNGSGKSTLLQILAGTLSSTEGSVCVNGRVAALLELGSGFNPDFTGRENVYLNGMILGLTQREVDDRFDQIVAFADIGDFIDQPVKTYSSGMFVRLAFAVQAHIDASIVIIDEALAVGDVFFRQKCYTRLEELRKQGAAILLVSHAMTDIEQYCENAVLLDHGKQSFTGNAIEATKHYYLINQSGSALAETSSQCLSPIVSPETFSVSLSELPRPLPQNFLNIDGLPQVSNGMAKCTAASLTNRDGELCNVFQQGDVAIFHYEYEIYADIEVPICGVVISNERGVIAHGKDTCQVNIEAPSRLLKGQKLVCQQEIQLSLGLGDYTFEIGLAYTSLETWSDRKNIPFEEFYSHHKRICHVANVSHFSVGLAMNSHVPVLTHHGVADLSGSIHFALS